MARQQSRGSRIISFLEKYVCIPDGEHVGAPMKLAPFQKRFIRDCYDNPHGTRRGYLSIARKNGKTALIAGLVLTHLVGPEAKQNTQIVSGASSRDQAALVFDLASKMLLVSPKLAGLVRVVPSGKRLIGLRRNVEYRALAADGTTAHGLSPILAILDEVGQIRGPRDAFVDAITTSQGAHEAPLLIAISTQAAQPTDLFSIWLDDAIASKDPTIVCHLHAAPDDCKIGDRKAWKAANPAVGIFRSEKDLAEQARQAERMPSSENTFRWLCLNQRVESNSPLVSRAVWVACSAEPDPEAFAVGRVYLGLDLSSRQDLTALVAVARGDDGVWSVRAEFFAPQDGVKDRAHRDRAPYDLWAEHGYLTLTPGASVDYAFVAERLCAWWDDYDVAEIAFDRWRIDVLKQELKRMGRECAEEDGPGMRLAPFGQGYKDMSPAIDTLEAELMNVRIRHGANPLLNWNAANAIAIRDPAGNRKLDKMKSTGRIDGMVALAMALGRAMSSEGAVSETSFWEAAA